MQDKTVLMGAILLEAFWETRQKDMLDLISPFVMYGVAKGTSPNDEIDINKVTQVVRNEFGYTDIPKSVIIKILNRNKTTIQRRERRYYLIATLDKIAERVDTRRTACKDKIELIEESLFLYLKKHCKRTKINSKEQAIESLQLFFKKYGIQLEFNTLIDEEISPNTHELDYYIAKYIYENKKIDSREYDAILELVKGFFLQTAIYIQGENMELLSASYNDLKVYYDTPLLLKLLGYESNQELEFANELHCLLKRQKAQFYYFPQTKDEIISILTAYQYSITGSRVSTRTLVGLDEKGYSFDGVTRLKNSFENKLENELGIKYKDMPPYKTNQDGSVNIEAVDMFEQEIKDYIKCHTKHYTEDNLNSDVTSALAIHRIRDGITSSNIEQCRALFVTTNGDFTRAFNLYYKDNKAKKCNIVMPVILASDLTAISWVKSSTANNKLPEKQLLTNAYAAMQPIPEIMDKCYKIMMQMESEGKITAEEVASIRSDRVTQRELWIEHMPSENEVDVNYLEELRKRHKDKLIKETKDEIMATNRQNEESRELKITQGIKDKADKYAKNERDKYLKRRTIHAILAEVIILGICICGWYKSLDSLELSISFVIFAIISIMSIVDTLIQKGRFIHKYIEKCANQYETKIYEKKKKEYMEIGKVD